jgi:hypothetical protein
VMAETFSVRPADDESLERASSTDLDNPFLTASYLESQRMLGREGWLLSLDDARAMRAAALCFLDRGRLRRTLMIPSSPPVDSDSPFWSGVRAFIAEHAITDLELSTFASPQSRIPRWPGELERIDRTEFAMPLKGFELLPRVSKRHRERISKGRRKGLVLRRDASDAAIDSHIALHITSMDRRKSLGRERVARIRARGISGAARFRCGRAIPGNARRPRVASSLLILRSTTDAYSESSGNSKEGMGIGASHFLRFECASTLQAEGVEVFYLGGVRPEEEGLRSFKAGFGTTPIETQSMSAYVGSPGRRHLSSAIQWLRSNAATRQ